MADLGHRAAPALGLPALSYERVPGAATAALPERYRRRQPETTALYRAVCEHLDPFLDEARERDGEGYPQFIEREFRRYLDCGQLERGFARLRCPECGFERLVAFSCKGRLCPSCIGRRMAETAAYLVDTLLPEAPYRQWVLSFPWPLRFRLAVDRRLFTALIGTFLRTVFAWHRRRGRALGIAGGESGAVTFVQRFGGALNLNPHLHSLIPDGLFVPGESEGEPLGFVPLPTPTHEEIEALTWRIARRLTRVIERLCADAFATEELFERTVASLRQALARSVEAPLPRAGVGLEDARPEPPQTPLCAKVAGFSLHAARLVPADDRVALERLCRYGLRAPFAVSRFSLAADGRIVYRLRKPWPKPGGARCLVLEPGELLKRLASLVPAPYSHMVRYHGVFANRSRWRPLLPSPPAVVDREDEPEKGTLPLVSGSAEEKADVAGDAAAPHRRRPLRWAQLLLRVFFVDALSCPRCTPARGRRVPMVVLALITDPQVLRRILSHLELPADGPPLAPRSPGGDLGPLFERGDSGARWPARPPP